MYIAPATLLFYVSSTHSETVKSVEMFCVRNIGNEGIKKGWNKESKMLGASKMITAIDEEKQKYPQTKAITTCIEMPANRQ